MGQEEVADTFATLWLHKWIMKIRLHQEVVADVIFTVRSKTGFGKRREETSVGRRRMHAHLSWVIEPPFANDF